MKDNLLTCAPIFWRQLKAAAPFAFSEGKMDVEALRRFLRGGDVHAPKAERYGLGWAGKTDALEVLRQPTLGTLNPAPDES